MALKATSKLCNRTSQPSTIAGFEAAALRVSLLPKLLSGELRVVAAENGIAA